MFKLFILGPSLNQPGGVSSFLSLLLNKLSAFDFNIKYLPIGRRNTFIYKILSLIFFVIDLCRYIILCIKFRPHIIHLNPSLGFKAIPRDCVYLLISKLLKHKVIFFIHGWDRRFYLLLGKNYILRFVFSKLLNKAEKVVVLCRQFADDLIKIGIDNSNIAVSFIPIEYYNYINLKEKKNKFCKILFLSTFQKDKGIYNIIKAIPLVTKKIEDDNIKFILVGDGPEMPNVRNLIDTMNLRDYVELPGYITGRQKYDFFKNSDIFVLPTSHGEGFPTVIAEAMAAGLPIIATPQGAIPEVVENGVNGIIISKPDPNDIAEAIIYLIKNPDLRKRMGLANREKARNYDISIFIKYLIDLYQEAAA